MKKPLLQTSSDGSKEIVIEGVISSDSWWGDETTPEQLRDKLASEANGEPITVVINSPGGEVFAGAAMYNALRNYSGRVTVRVDGVAASMASVIAMVGDEIIMSPGATMMVHRPSVMAWGNAKDLKDAINMLEEIEDTILPIYEKRTGKSRDEVFALLDETTWMSADKAVELGFADKVDDDEPKASMLDRVNDKVKAMLGSREFQFTMSVEHKSLANYVAKAETEENTKVSTEEPKPDEETPVETPAPVEEPTPAEPAKVEEPTPAEEPAPQEPVEPTQAANTKPTNSEKEKPEMSKPIAADTVVAPVALADPAASTVEAEKLTMKEARTLVAHAFGAKFNKDEKEFNRINDELKAKMVINGTSGAPLYGQEVLANDIRQAYLTVGRVGQLVNRIDIEGAETFRQLVETAGNGFTPVALGATKDLDQPVWTSVTFEPFEWALIVAWLDGVQKRSPIAIYNQIVRYIAREFAKLEDKIVLTYEGGTYDGEARPATGLVPILTTASRVDSVASYESADLVPALATAYGEIESDETITLVANRRTWAQMAVSMDANDNTIFNRVGEQVVAGALGSFNLVQSQVLEDGDVVIGAFSDYNLVTRGGLEYLFSREATVGEGEGALNLFTNDASALRADVDITGKPVVNTSFFLLQFPAGS